MQTSPKNAPSDLPPELAKFGESNPAISLYRSAKKQGLEPILVAFVAAAEYSAAKMPQAGPQAPYGWPKNEAI